MKSSLLFICICVNAKFLLKRSDPFERLVPCRSSTAIDHCFAEAKDSKQPVSPQLHSSRLGSFEISIWPNSPAAPSPRINFESLITPPPIPDPKERKIKF